MNATFIEWLRVIVLVPGFLLYVWATVKVAHRPDMREQHLMPMVARMVVVGGLTFVAVLALFLHEFTSVWTNVSQLIYLGCGVIIIWLGLGYYYKQLRG